jgi:hypothetical protein
MSEPQYSLLNLSTQPEPGGLFTPPDTDAPTHVLEAFQHTALTGSHQDPNALVKDALTYLRNQMVGPWLPEHKRIRDSVLWIIANPVEARELAESLLSQKEGEHAR